ncbi:hypothetical protein, partial [Bacillus mycoides]|uniref:hypothetical protein n=1 Tax=Bacillus mycoides TaxID=1405 RepID=UPI001A9A1FAB
MNKLLILLYVPHITIIISLTIYKYPYFYNWIFPYTSTFVIRNEGIGGVFEQITDSIICTTYH